MSISFPRITRRSPQAASADASSAVAEAATIEAAPRDAADAPLAAFEPGSFDSLGVAPDLVAVLKRSGVTAPTPIQASTIADALDGRDVSGRARTGSGKTLAYCLPLIERTSTARKRRPHSLVLVPTRELATQVAAVLTPLAVARQLWLCPIYGGVSMSRQIRALQAGVDIVIATPGRLNDLIERDEVSVADVRFVVLDEADQMSDMGFLPQIRRILDRIEGQPQTLLFSATLDGAVDEVVRRYQHDPVRHAVAAEAEEDAVLDQRFIGVATSDRVAVSADICAGAERALVFVSTTHGADRVVEDLERLGLPAAALHGRLSQNKRERTLSDFSAGRIRVLVATNVAARGLHVDGIEVVIHFDPPEDGKVYLHRTGRTARAGATGLVVTLVQPEHRYAVQRLIHEVGLRHEIVEMRPGDPRLADLAAWEPPMATGAPVGGRYSVTTPRRGPTPRGGRMPVFYAPAPRGGDSQRGSRAQPSWPRTSQPRSRARSWR